MAGWRRTAVRRGAAGDRGGGRPAREPGVLLEKGRITLDRDPTVWIADFLQTDRVVIAELTPTAAVAAARLSAAGFPGDPADAYLYATARERDVPLLPKDERARGWARQQRDLRIVW